MFLRFLLHRRHHNTEGKELAVPVKLIHKIDATPTKAARFNVVAV